MLDDVEIRRNKNCAIIDYKKDKVQTTYLQIGSHVNKMSSQEILDLHNQCLMQAQKIRETQHYVANEIPVGSPQIAYFKEGKHWIPRAEVLRCTIDESEHDFETIVRIDEQEFTMKKFGELLSAYVGWGMRIIMVPDDEIYMAPAVEINDPEMHNEGSLALHAGLVSRDKH